ncbi:MAG TPA: amino acid permease [Gammaproteobacteria bacterium]|nr:amino acid permease [Gammaproteobacteria bacterium]
MDESMRIRAADEPATAARTLPRRLGTWTGMAVVIGIIIGSGIFTLPPSIAGTTGNITGLALVWVVGGIITLFGALSTAELATMFPHSGGPYVYLREAYGRPLAFLFGWIWLITTALAWAAQSLVFMEYLAKFAPITPAETHWLAAALIVLFAAAHYRSVRLGALFQNVSTTAKVLAVVGLAVAIFVLAPNATAAPAAAATGSLQWAGIGVGLVTVLWAYDGWENLTTLAGEMRRPQRSLPMALIGGTLIVIVVYLVINAAYLRALPFDTLIGSKAVAVDSAVTILGHAGATAVGALVMVSVLGSLNGSVMSDPRVFYAMAEDRLFFQSVGKVHPRFETPYVAIVFTCAIAVIYVLFRDFIQLARAYVLGIWPFLALSVIGLFVLRRKRPDAERPYRVIGYPVVPALFVLGTFGVIGYSLYEKPEETAISLGLTLLGIPLYFLWLYWEKRRTQHP